MVFPYINIYKNTILFRGVFFLCMISGLLWDTQRGKMLLDASFRADIGLLDEWLQI